MTVKSYGTGISAYLDPEGRSWETTVFQAGKPLLDKELNLSQDLSAEAEFQFRRRTMPSGWMADDILSTQGGTVGTDAIYNASAVANELLLIDNLRAHVNGWLIRVSNTGASGVNKITLPAAPAGAGTKRSDIVVLEVWRRVIEASPSTVGKSPSARIWRNGNVKVASGDDVALNYADDILDGAVGSATTKRVQIQYRLRAISGVNLFTYLYGLDDPAVVANSVPTNAATPDGAATVFAYTNQSSDGDPGLWRAGDGNPANTLGTVDGYMYAIPMFGVFRRNTAAWNRNTNHNGGVASPGPSDRPDGLFYDIIDIKDVIDLRMGVSASGWNYTEVLEKNFNSLLDNQLITELTTTTLGGGVNGHLHLFADEIGITNAHGGDGTTTGDTPGASFIGEFDAVRRHFSDRSILETMTLRYVPADGSGGGPNWTNNSIITIDPSSLPVYPYTAFNWASFTPGNISIAELQSATFIGVGGAKRQASVGMGTAKVSGLGVVPAASISFNIGTVPAGITDEPLYIRFTVAYPKGAGLTKTPAVDLGSTGLIINNSGALPAGSPVLYEGIQTQTIDAPHRELSLMYRTVSQTISFSVANSGTTSSLVMPERVLSVSAVTVNGGAYAGVTSISTDGYTLSFTVPHNPGDFVTVTFKAVRPMPQNGEQVTLFYYAVAPQTAREALIGTSLALIPRCISSYLYSMTAGSGSENASYPFEQQYVQMPGIYPASGGSFDGDHELDAPGRVTIRGMSTDGGFLKLPTLVPMVAPPDQFTLTRAPGDVDAEGRSYFKTIPGSTYLPNAFAEPLATPVRHRCVLPVLAELATDSTLGPKGQLVLVLIGSWNARPGIGSTTNSVAFDSTLATNFTSASVYRIKGNLLNRRSS